MQQIKKPIFIGGSGRSGTSLLFRILSKNEQCVSFGGLESKFIISNDGLLDLFSKLHEHYNIGRANAGVARFKTLMNRLKSGGVYGENGLEKYLKNPKVYDQILNKFLREINQYGNIPRPLRSEEVYALFKGFISQLILNLRGYNPQKRFIEKTPHNFLHLEFFHHLFSDLKFLHIVRDPRAVALSLTKQTWAPNEYHRACWWLHHVYNRYHNQNNFQKYSNINHLMLLRLEDLGEQPDLMKQKLESFLEIDKLVIDKSQIKMDKINYWKAELSQEQISTANRILGRYIENFGYKLNV